LEKLTHIFFVDDVPIFYYCIKFESKHYKEILDLFCDTTGVVVNFNNFSIYFLTMVDEIRQHLSKLFSFPLFELENGIKYLWYVLKLKNYGISRLELVVV